MTLTAFVHDILRATNAPSFRETNMSTVQRRVFHPDVAERPACSSGFP